MSRNVLAVVLVVLGCLLAGPAVAAYALAQEIAQEDQYLDAVGPLADDAAVRQAIANRVTDAISAKLGPGDRELPASMRRIVSNAVTKAVESEAFRPAWHTVNRLAHPQVVAMLRGETGAGLRIEDDAVLLDLGAVLAEVKRWLAEEGLPLANQIGEIDASVQLFSRPAVRRAIPAFGTLEALSIALPVTVILLLVAGLVVSTRRRRTLVIAGVGVAVAMLLLVLYQWIGRSQLMDRSQTPELAGAFYDALTNYLKILLWLVFGIAVAAAIGGLLSSLRQRRAA